MNREGLSAAVRAALADAFNKLHGEGAGVAEWTKAIKEALCAEGARAGLRTAAHGTRSSWCGEWAYDVCWLRYASEGTSDRSLVDPELDFLTEAILVVESEFGNLGDIRDDFQKLLIARASARCMIWDDRLCESPSVAEWLSAMVRNFSGTCADDFYLLAGYTDNGFRFWHVGGDGCPVAIPRP